MYKKVLVKISGELFGGNSNPFDFAKFDEVAKSLLRLQGENDLKMAIVIGGGNVWRFRDMQDAGLDRVMSDRLGMLATVFNCQVLQNSIVKNGGEAVVFSAVNADPVAKYEIEIARKCFEEGKIVVLAGGTGNPFFTTDSAAAERGVELNCDLIMKATKVDGVYSDDPKKNLQAVRYETLKFDQVIIENLEVMDMTAISLCKENNIPILVFDFTDTGNLDKVFKDFKIGTLVSN